MVGKTFDDVEERKLVVSLLDSDGDGEVSFREFFRWWKSHKDKFFVSSYSEVRWPRLPRPSLCRLKRSSRLRNLREALVQSQDVKAAIYYFKKVRTMVLAPQYNASCSVVSHLLRSDSHTSCLRALV